jgi:hypothetical protein
MCDDPKPTTPYAHKAPYVPKVASEDATLTVSKADGGKMTFPVLSGTEIRIHIPGLHYNRRLSDIVIPRTGPYGVL